MESIVIKGKSDSDINIDLPVQLVPNGNYGQVVLAALTY